MIYSFVCQFPLHCYWYCYNHKQSSGCVLRERWPYKFCKFHKKTPALKAPFKWSCRSTEIYFIKREITALMFSCKFCEISHNTFLKEPFGQLLLHLSASAAAASNTCFDYFPATNFSLFQKRCHTHFPAEYFVG